MEDPYQYHGVQRAPLCWLIYALALLFLLLSWMLWKQPSVAWIMLASGLLLAIMAGAFHYLEVIGERERIHVRFGPLPLFRRTVLYVEIESFAVGRTRWWDGWGIHYTDGGWTWNLWGRDCVVLNLRKGKFRVGTNDPVGLAAHLGRHVTGRMR